MNTFGPTSYTPVQSDQELPFDSLDRQRAQGVMDQLGTFLNTTFGVVCTARDETGHLRFHIQDADSMQTATITVDGILTIGNIDNRHLLPAEVMLDLNGLTAGAMRELSGMFGKPLTWLNTPEHLREHLFNVEAMATMHRHPYEEPRPNQAALLHVMAP